LGESVRKFAVVLACGCLVVSVPAQARDYYYFHKASVTREAYQADRLECERLMGGVRKRSAIPTNQPWNQNLTSGQNLAVVGITSLFEGMMRAGERRRTANAVERTCMADKGYTRFSVPDELAEDIEHMPDPEARLSRYFAMAAASEPIGERMVE
jgi:hypothetical protein